MPIPGPQDRTAAERTRAALSLAPRSAATRHSAQCTLSIHCGSIEQRSRAATARAAKYKSRGGCVPPNASPRIFSSFATVCRCAWCVPTAHHSCSCSRRSIIRVARIFAVACGLLGRDLLRQREHRLAHLPQLRAANDREILEGGDLLPKLARQIVGERHMQGYGLRTTWRWGACSGAHPRGAQVWRTPPSARVPDRSQRWRGRSMRAGTLPARHFRPGQRAG